MNELYTEEQMNMTKHRLRLLRKEKGLSYEDYLQIFLLTSSKAQKIEGGMDMIESSFRETENWEEFQLDHCITALEASVDVKANGKKTYTVAREYHYI